MLVTVWDGWIFSVGEWISINYWENIFLEANIIGEGDKNVDIMVICCMLLCLVYVWCVKDVVCKYI